MITFMWISVFKECLNDGALITICDGYTEIYLPVYGSIVVTVTSLKWRGSGLLNLSCYVPSRRSHAENLGDETCKNCC